ncbi:MAG: DUF1573 domain-containing protein [Chitinophagaceae bacterium]
MSLRPFFFVAFFSSVLVSCINNDVKTKPTAADSAIAAENAKAMDDTANYTTIEWIDSVRDFGKVQEGPKLDILFRFKNTGTKPLVIADVHPGCGCTVAEKPTHPIMPGQAGEIKGQFETNGHTGVNNKSITVRANTKPEPSFNLKFSVQVEKKG